MGDQRRYWRATMVFGLLAIATAVWFLTRPMPACGGAPLTSAMLDFEMATTQPEFAAVIDCAPRRAELDFQNIVDLLLFMWAYVGFLTAAMLAAGVRRGVAIGLAALMLGGDFVETAILRQIAAAWPALDAGMVTVLAIAVRVKFAAIGIAMLAAALKLWGRGGNGPKLVAALTAIGGVAALAIIPPTAREAASQLVVVGWLALLVYAAVIALRSRRPAPSSAGA
jgi:hypothetical protein